MNAGLVLVGIGLGVLITIVVTAWMRAASGIAEQPQDRPPDTREQVIARLLLHRARRAREIAHLERYMSDRTADRLSRWSSDDEPWPPARRSG